MEEDAAPSTALMGISLTDPAEDTKAEDTNSGASMQPASSASVTPPGTQDESPQMVEATVQHEATEESHLSHDSIDGATLSEVRSSLQTISNGVEELATTVKDLLGLSESEHDSSDCSYDSNDRPTFSWNRLKSRARKRRKRRGLLKKHAEGGHSIGAEDGAEMSDEGLTKLREVILGVSECNFEQFQSRPAGEDHKLHCIEVLIAGDSLEDEIRDFELVISNIKAGKTKSWKPGQPSKRAEDTDSQDSDKKWIRRIRINSQAVMKVVRKVCGVPEDPKFQPVVFHRPFQVLVSRNKEMKEELANLKRLASASSNEVTDPTESEESADSSNTLRHSWHSATQEKCEDKQVLDELACFMDFMESRIMPDSRRYREKSSLAPETIRYEDIWYLFKPGDLVYFPMDTSSRDAYKASPLSQRILRLMQTHVTTTSAKRRPIGSLLFDKPWSFFCHFIEYDGASYSFLPFAEEHLAKFSGEKKVTDLPIYPISYLKDDQIMAQAQSDGTTYVNLIERRFGYHSGWTQTTNPFGRPLADDSSEGRLASPQHIESDILVDYQETFNAFPKWKLIFYRVVLEHEQKELVPFQPRQDELPILEWDEAGRTKHEQFDHVLSVDGTEIVEGWRFLKNNMLGEFSNEKQKAPTGQLLALLPRRFFAYAVLERKFVQLDTRSVRSTDLEANDTAFTKLEINPNYKKLILALVKSHFAKIEAEKRTNVEIETQDLIRGKGKGVVILLHGVPGVGKTATAEAVALKWKKPLFPITCGDLGYTAETLEKSLNEIFRLAHHWGCILLLDEADVFITRRERHDLKRNALVSAFLRVLEYYNGIMFLTTNRAGVLDEAVKSRVHLNLHYDHLNEEQTVAIFKQHIQRLRDIEKQRNADQNDQIVVLHKEILQFARDHFNQRHSNHGSGSSFGRWNGRQIRNAFLIASSLAHYDDEDEGGDESKDDLAEPDVKIQKQLGRKQFELVAEITLLYDQYRESVHSAKSEDHIAAEREERATPSQPRPRTPDRLKHPSKSFG
ncbi:hypothetical protein Daus18300_002859 [Diaporthe australafricana]|uniref:AAA+ ATPase domain-containing protein n=1 Tax=Diaporthe australafricana TaxID=127596 RepID=A0ABR3XJT9_9PEZI